MKSKLNLRLSKEDKSNNKPTDVEVEITDQTITGVTVLNQGLYDVRDFFPATGDRAKTNLLKWCEKKGRFVKLPSEPDEAYRKVENLMQLGDLIGCGRVD